MTTTALSATHKPAGVIETHHADAATEWGYSFTSHNPEPDDYICCASEADAWKLDKHICRIESALASAEPVAWSRTDDITDDDGCPIGTDEPRVVWGSEHPDPSETWFPLYGGPMPATRDAKPAAKVEAHGDGLRDYPYLIGLAKVLRMRGDPENAKALDSVAERIRRTAPTPASVPDDGMKAAIAEARAYYSGVWPEQLTSGVMFFKGFRITQDRFNHSKANTSEPPHDHP